MTVVVLQNYFYDQTGPSPRFRMRGDQLELNEDTAERLQTAGAVRILD